MYWLMFVKLFALLSFVNADAGAGAEADVEAGADNYKTAEGVIVLTNNNFKSVIQKFEYVLVEFYAPWCGHCKQLAPEYAKAAQALEKEGSPIKLAKVDATEENELAEEYGVRGYPTLKFFRHASPIEYSGGRQADSIISWVKKKTGPAALEIVDILDIEVFAKNNTVGIIGYFKDKESESAKTFLSVASAIDHHPFAVVYDKAIHTEKKIEADHIALHKQFDEGEVHYKGDITEEGLKSFVTVHSLPLVVEFSHQTATKIFGGEVKHHLLIFFSKSAGHFDKHLKDVQEAAKAFREKVLFVTIDTDEEDHSRILEFFGMKKDEIPGVRAIKLAEDMAKFKPESTDLSEEYLKKFVGDFLEGKVKQHYLTQELPEDWDAKPVKVLVSTKFREVVMDPTKTVLVEFYAPWCGHCKQLAPIYDQLAESFEDREDIVIAKLDATANEIEDTKISSFPTITLYPKDKSKVVEYSGERTLEGLKKFVETEGESFRQAPEAEAEPTSEEAEEKEEEKKEPAKDEL